MISILEDLSNLSDELSKSGLSRYQEHSFDVRNDATNMSVRFAKIAGHLGKSDVRDEYRHIALVGF